MAQVYSAFPPSGVDKSSTSFGWGYSGDVASVGWQVKLCDPIRHESYCGAETTETTVKSFLCATD